MPTIEDPTSAPNNKVVVATIASAIGMAVYAFVEAHVDWVKNAGTELKLTVLPALAAAITFGPAWLKKNLEAFSQEVHSHRQWWMLGGGVVAVVVLGLLLSYFIG